MLWIVSFGSLLLAAYVPGRSSLLLIAVVWLGTTVAVIPLHFFRAWRKFRSVPNKGEYACWVGIETLGTCAFVVCALGTVCR
jgi:hypothetical protein